MPRRSLPRDPGWLVPALVVLLLIALAFWLVGPRQARLPQSAPPASPAGYLFCHWNVENFYDDQDDPQNHDEDEDWFALNPQLVREKAEHLAHALLLQNDGRGPDILALVEVESRRAMELLRDALNQELSPAWQYGSIVQRDYRLERRLAPAVLTRLPVREDLSRLLPARRILEVHLEQAGTPLVVLSSHWTSRLRSGTEEKREAYAEALYQRYLQLADSDPAADVLISGDFNDEPDSPSVRLGLRTTPDPDDAREGTTQPRLFDLMSSVDPEQEGTYFHNGRWQILDHIVASPGLLDPAGWLLVPQTIHTENSTDLRFGRSGRPWRFGGPQNENPRGYSDHFPVTVRLRLHSQATN